MAHRFSRRLARLRSVYFDSVREEAIQRLSRQLAAGTPAVVAAFDEFKQRQAEAEQALGRHVSAAKLIRWPGIDAAMERLFILAHSANEGDA